VSGSELEEFAARLELGQANLPAAQQHLERATQGQPPSREAYLTLAEIAWRHQEPRRAIELLQQGLALPLRPNESDSTFRPMFQLRLGLAARAAGDEALAQRSLTEAEQALAALTRSLEGNARAHAYFLHAAALDALGRTDEVRRDLDAAVNAAPENKDLAAALVTFCLGRGRWRDAFEIDRAARARLQLDRTWKTYFALWGATAARLARIEQDGGAMEALREIAENANEHSPWIERLAQRFVGAIDREQLMRYAGASAGHRAEALFYEAMLQLGAGDLAGAENDLRAVLQTEMLRYFEYDMAWEMLSRGLPALVEAARAAAAATPTAPAATPAPAPAPAPARTPSPRHPRR
jgi:tetratricopeptide (TPR) repeat protein